MACNACMTIPPVEASYTPQGQTLTTADGLEIYVASPPPSTTTTTSAAGIIYVPDIFGKTSQAFQVCDKLAAAGFWVAFPDVFRGKPWPMEKFPPSDREELMGWIGGYTYEDKVKPDVAQALAVLKEKAGGGGGAEGGMTMKMGIVGFCWGGKISTFSSEDGFEASAAAHPSFLTEEDAEVVNCPILLLPSKDEADLSGFIEAVLARGMEARQIKFDDMHHGWVAARGDWSDERQKERATKAIQLLVDFFSKHLK